MSKLTIAVPTYNRSYYLKEMLDSILQQTCSDFFVKIYDNCSTDNTTETVKPYLLDKRFSYHRHITSVNNFHYILKDVTTEYLLMAHDDDTMLPDMVKEERAILDLHEDVSLVSTNANYINTKGEVIEPSGYNNCNNKWLGNDRFINSREYINFITIANKPNIICCPTVMLRMPVIRKHNFQSRIDIGGASDYFAWLELNQLDYKFYYINKALYNYRIHSGQDHQLSPFLYPRLRKPVYYLLSENKHSRQTINEWLKFINKTVAIDAITYGYDVFWKHRENILFYNKLDFALFFAFFRENCVLYKKYFRKFKKKLKIVLKRIIPHRIWGLGKKIIHAHRHKKD